MKKNSGDLKSLLTLACLTLTLSGCRLFDSSSADSENPIATQSRLYIASDTSVYVCNVDDDSSLSDCIDSGNTGIAFSGASNIAINSSRTIAYVSNSLDNTISVCPLNTNGKFGDCAHSGSGFTTPMGVTLNSSDDILYVVNNVSNIVTRCALLPDGALSSCTDTGAPSLNAPAGIALNPAGTYAYITNFADSVINSCTIESNGDFSNCMPDISMSFESLLSLAINPEGTRFYVANNTSYSIRKCDINVLDGTLGACSDSGNSGATIANPKGITLNVDGSVAFVSDSSNVYKCPINTDGSFGACSLAGQDLGITNGLFFVGQ